MEKSIMQKDFETFLKQLGEGQFVSTESDFGDRWYSFPFSGNIYIALYSNQTDSFVRIQRKAGNKEDGDSELFNLLVDELGGEEERTMKGISECYTVGGNPWKKEIFIYNY